VAKRNSHSDKHNRELTDLGHRQPGEEPRALAVAHDRHHDQRIADEDEQREHDGGDDFVTQRGEVQLADQVDEEEQQHEVADARQARIHGFPVRGGGQREAGDKSPRFLAEAGVVAERGEPGAPGDRKDQQQLLRPRHAADQSRQDMEHEHVHQYRGPCQA